MNREVPPPVATPVAGARLRGPGGDPGEIIVVRPPTTPVALTWTDQGSVQLGKRYEDEVSRLEVLCTRGGPGSVEVDGRALTPKAAKPLPASD